MPSINRQLKPLAQVKQLRAAGAAKVFNETASSAKTDHIQLRRTLDQLAKGDVLMLTRSRRFRARDSRSLNIGIFRGNFKFEPPIGPECSRETL